MTLKQHILGLVHERGPIPFEEFMDLALYHPQGFFGGDVLRSDKGGDFLTSPEVSSLFGETLAVYIDRVRDGIGEPFHVVDVGAGSGSLLQGVLGAIEVEVHAVDRSPAARRELNDLAIVSADLPERIRGVVVANELLDNVPMAMAQRMDGQWRERWVGADNGTLTFIDADPRAEVENWLQEHAGEVPDGGWVEVQLEARALVEDLIQRVERGALLFFDYGDTKEGLLPRRADGTLRTYQAHHLGPHPLDEPGATDITADVNFSALLDVHPTTRMWRQDDFLSGLGLRERLSELRHLELDSAREGDDERRLLARSARTEAETLLHPRGLGDFRVLEILVDTGTTSPADTSEGA